MKPSKKCVRTLKELTEAPRIAANIAKLRHRTLLSAWCLQSLVDD